MLEPARAGPSCSQSQTLAQRQEEEELMLATVNLERLLRQSPLDESAQHSTQQPRLLLKLPCPLPEKTTKSKKRPQPLQTGDMKPKTSGQKRKRTDTNSVLNSHSQRSVAAASGLISSSVATSSHVSANCVILSSSAYASHSQLPIAQTSPHIISLSDLLFFDLFFDFIIAPSLDSTSGPENISHILSRTRVCLYKYMLMNSFVTMLQLSSAQQPANIETLFHCFTQCAQALGLAFS